MNPNSDLVINAHKNIVKAYNDFFNSKVMAHDTFFNGDKKIENSEINHDLDYYLKEKDNASLKLWLAIAEDTKDINPSLKNNIESNTERYSSFSSSDSCWVSRLWNIDTEYKRCNHCGKVHRSFL